jgi:hypothetical protein
MAPFFTGVIFARTAGRASAWAPRLSTRNAQRRTGQRFVRCTTSGVAGNGLSTSIKYLRRTMNTAAGSGLSRCQGLLMYPFTTSTLARRADSRDCSCAPSPRALRIFLVSCVVHSPTSRIARKEAGVVMPSVCALSPSSILVFITKIHTKKS